MSFNTICIDQAPYFTWIQLASPWHPSSGLGPHQGQQAVAIVSLDFFFRGVAVCQAFHVFEDFYEFYLLVLTFI